MWSYNESIVDDPYDPEASKKMLEEEGATIRPRKKNVPTKLKPGLYVYERDPFFVRIGNKQVGTGKTREAAEEVRDAFLKKLR